MSSPLRSTTQLSLLGSAAGTPSAMATVASTTSMMAQPPVSAGSSVQTVHTYHNENTIIYKELCRFEEELQRLTGSIQQYAPDPEVASEIVVSTDTINAELDKIQLLHEMRSNQIVKQNTENDSLNEGLRNILVTLSDCRQELEELPKVGSDTKKVEEPDVSPSSLDSTKQLLAYAMKLSKFSRIPRTFDGFLLPNNFLWPGDDNMRRGMLAAASKIPKEVVEAENGKEEVAEEAEEVKKVEKEEEESGGSDMEIDRPETEVFGAREAQSKPKDASEVMTGLDLFDDDDEDDD